MQKENSQHTKKGELSQEKLNGSPTLQWMKEKGIPLTREMFIQVNWGKGITEDDLGAELSAEIPEGLK